MMISALIVLNCPITLPSHGRGHKFETCTAHQNIKLNRLKHGYKNKYVES